MATENVPGGGKPGKGIWFWLSTGLALVLAAGLLVCVYYTAQIIVNPEPVDKFTELYVLGPEGRAEGYPKTMVVGENKTLVACVVSHENEEANYRLVVCYNNSSAERSDYSEDFTLEDNSSWRRDIKISPDLAGNKVKVRFQLYKDGNTGEPYRECYLWLNVSEPYRHTNASSNKTGSK